MALSNLSSRVLVSIIAIPIILAASYFGSFFFYAFVIIVSLIAYYEFTLMVQRKNVFPNLVFGGVAIAFILSNQYKPFLGIFTVFVVIVLLVTLIELFRNKSSALLNISTTLLGVFYIGLFSSALMAIREFYPNIDNLYSRGGFIVISMLASIWICDSAAYFIGTAIGKHKLFPRISPNKSWEGAISGLVFAVITMIAAKFIVLEFFTTQSAIIIGLLIGIFGQTGDLIESMFKRDVDVKDSSGIIPGHGGVFDRFDSLLYSSPVVWLYLKYFN
jgi:phosphatidate cytidylyltransferase